MYYQEIKINNKFLGVTFDERTTFKQYIQNLKVECMKRLNMMKILSNNTWGADQETLFLFYKTVIRSKIEYAPTIYGNTTKTILKTLNPMHYQGICLALGILRSTPVSNIYTISGEPTLKFRRE